MNVLWLIMIIVSILYALYTGNVGMVNDVFVDVGKDTFDFVLPLICVCVFWNGLLYVAKDAGITRFLERLMHPLLKWLFPDLKHDDETLGYVATNVVVNMIGLGSAATPVGLKAMEGMQKHNDQKDTATRSMVTFLVLNTAGVTLFSTTLVAMRSSFHSIDVMGFLPYAICSTLFASMIGIMVDRWWNYRG
ncbi:spore maturation protein A [[Eubacterium] hominis]|uniref:spore maturation protein A n=1 Tax=[Eubacterium] hominis TaxID=2764325 RepID=UPI003A4D2CC5